MEQPDKRKIYYPGKELEYIETYLRLEKYRYDDQLEVEIKVDDSCLDDIVPKLILQPPDRKYHQARLCPAHGKRDHRDHSEGKRRRETGDHGL